MPELIEVEYYRQALNGHVGSRVDCVELLDAQYQRPKDAPGEVLEQLVGSTLAATRRRGKLLLADFTGTNSTLTLGLRFGMTGRLLFNGAGPIDQLEYSSRRDNPGWDRFALTLGHVRMSIRDQRRLGSVELDPSLDGLGPDAATISTRALSKAIDGRTKAIKAALLDQSIVAGLGNLLCDEVLWRMGLSPHRSCEDLNSHERHELAETTRTVIAELTQRGGSNCGDSFELRHEGALCPRCPGREATMAHETVGGRSTWWCPAHQH